MKHTKTQSSTASSEKHSLLLLMALYDFLLAHFVKFTRISELGFKVLGAVTFAMKQLLMPGAPFVSVISCLDRHSQPADCYWNVTC